MSDAVPVYHNICGRRTAFKQCGCQKCSERTRTVYSVAEALNLRKAEQ
jgi:hypothetical protein